MPCNINLFVSSQSRFENWSFAEQAYPKDRPLIVAFYDTQGDAEDLFSPGSRLE
jgi:hypothetical protein